VLERLHLGLSPSVRLAAHSNANVRLAAQSPAGFLALSTRSATRRYEINA